MDPLRNVSDDDHQTHDMPPFAGRRSDLTPSPSSQPRGVPRSRLSGPSPRRPAREVQSNPKSPCQRALGPGSRAQLTHVVRDHRPAHRAPVRLRRWGADLCRELHCCCCRCRCRCLARWNSLTSRGNVKIGDALPVDLVVTFHPF